MSQGSQALSPALLEKARVELNEIQSDVPDHIQRLRQRILADPKLNFRTDDAFLLRFLRARKFDQKRAFELLTNHYRHRQNFPSLFRKAAEFHRRDGWTSKIMELLPGRDSDGRMVNIFSYRHWDVNLISLEEVLCILLLIAEHISMDETVQINGLVFIVDLEGGSLSHLKQWTPQMIKAAASVFVNSIPLRMKAIHYVNMTPLFDSTLAILNSLFSKKIRERNFYHGDCLASLHEHIDPEILPVELGGDLGPPDENLWAEAMKKRAQALAEDLRYGFLNNK